ncbi:hypothetical protein A6E15_16795 [Natrinema saccharevitans]|uniref:Uncharacterized protein n=1 Tax=Natrinema saccharevitans TaxID=301967 RepID=A0A1S8B0Y8_9EURY|nr:metalloprotease family protein [Natrinema saccharevitans]OLZ42516.1 hypothetical protein A6E15_16795 [Natrinema saccharevitans]
MSLRDVRGRWDSGLHSFWAFVGLLFAPGIVVHELAHAGACRLLGVKLTQTRLVGLPVIPAGLTKPALGWVRHERPRSAWKAFLIAIAPLVVNTVAALSVFTAVTRSLLPVDVITYPNTVSGLVRLHWDILVVETGLQTQLLGLLGLWIGVSLAVTAMPSTRDALNTAIVSLETEGLERRLVYGPSVVLFVLAASAFGFGLLYAVALTAVGLGGREALVAVRYDFIGYALASVVITLTVERRGFVGIVRSRLTNPSRSFLELTPVVLSRILSLQQEMEADEPLTDEAIAFLVAHLDHGQLEVRYQSASALATVAWEDHSRLGAWMDRLIERAVAEPVDSVRVKLLYSISAGAIPDTDRELLRDVSIDALTAESTDLRLVAAQVVGRLAKADPGLVAAHVETVLEALTDDELSETARGNLAVAVSRIAGEVPSAVRPYRDDLASHRTDSNEKVATFVERALKRTADGAGESRSDSHEG